MPAATIATPVHCAGVGTSDSSGTARNVVITGMSGLKSDVNCAPSRRTANVMRYSATIELIRPWNAACATTCSVEADPNPR